ncbi:MAG: RrF2 family transcriptional regulator [Candidatus Ratteibacteria bacterium]
MGFGHMFISTRVRYGVRALIELGMNYQKQAVLLKDISKRQNLSLKYLDHIFMQLKTKGIIKKIKAKRGGYLLAKSPENITLYEIIEAIEGIKKIECLEDEKVCFRSSHCGARIVWERLNAKVDEVLKSITLQDFVRESEKFRQMDEPVTFSI